MPFGTKVLRLFLCIVSPLTARLFFALIFCAASPAASPAVAQIKGSQTVAEIDSIKITKAQLDQELRKHLREELDRFDEADRHTLSKQMLNSIIERKLILLEAEKKKLIPSDKQVQKFIEDIRSELGSRELLNKELQKYGVTEEHFASGLREDLAIKEYLERFVFKSLRVSEEEIRVAYDKDPKQYAAPLELRIRDIMLRVSGAPTEVELAELQKKAEKILLKANQEETDFASLARKYSEANSKSKGGDLGFLTANQLQQMFGDTELNTEVGAVTGVFRAGSGLHVVKVEAVRGGSVLGFEEVRDKIKDKLLREKRQKLLAAHVRELRGKHKVIVYYY